MGAGLHNVFSKVQQGVNLALNETTKGIQQLVQKVGLLHWPLISAEAAAIKMSTPIAWI